MTMILMAINVHHLTSPSLLLPQLHAEATPVRITRGGAHGLIMHYVPKGGAPGELREVQCGLVMVATGRKPRTHALGLEVAGVEVDQEGAIKVISRSKRRALSGNPA